MSNLNALAENLEDDAMRAAVKAVVAAGDTTKTIDLHAAVKHGDGHRSIVTEADTNAERILVDGLLSAFPNAKILSEEDAAGPNILDKNNPAGILDEDLVFVIDPIDGTAPRASNLATWCVSCGIMRRGALVGSAVYAPAINGGMLVTAQSEGQTTRVQEWNFGKWNFVPTLYHRGEKETRPKDSFVLVGVDSTLYPSAIGVFPAIATNVRCMGIANSGILGLAQVAARRVQAIVQTPQKAWDWAGAYRAVVQSGNVFRFFRLMLDPDNPGMEMLIEQPADDYDLEAFCYLPKYRRLGFVAGEPKLSQKILDLLPRKGWARTNPETVAGNWK